MVRLITYYVSALGSTGTAIGLKYQRGTCGTGVIVLRRCGASGRLGCYINGASLNEKGTDSSGLNSFYTLNSLTAAALTHLRLHSEGGDHQQRERIRVLRGQIGKAPPPEFRGAAVHD